MPRKIKLKVLTGGVKFGKSYEDTVLGRKGIATAQVKNTNGIDEVCLQRLDNNNEKKEFWVSIENLKGPAIKPLKGGIELNIKYKEKILGREGMATSQVKYMTGCDRVGLAYLNKDGDKKDFWVDVTELEGIQPKVTPPGGPNSTPPEKSMP